MLYVDSPKVERRILPSITEQQLEVLLKNTESLRDRCIISLLSDSGMRLNELTNMDVHNINWHDCTVTIWGKGKNSEKHPSQRRQQIYFNSTLLIIMRITVTFGE